jgi:heme a synthase
MNDTRSGLNQDASVPAPESSFRRWCGLTTVTTYLLLAVGGLVRASGAGLGCPDWPKCFDRWIPPTHRSQVPASIDPMLFNVTKAWLEYLNRALGVVVGILILGTLVLALRHFRHRPRVWGPVLGATLLVGFQGWLGGQVVLTGLRPLVLTLHLVVALVIAGLLVYAFMASVPVNETSAGFSGGLRRPALLAATALLAQITLGALVRGEVQDLQTATQLPRSEWFAHLSGLARYHQQLAVPVAAALAYVSFLGLRAGGAFRWSHRLSQLLLVLLSVQVLAGYALAYFSFPPLAQVLHLWVATLLMATLTVLACGARLSHGPTTNSAVSVEPGSVRA